VPTQPEIRAAPLQLMMLASAALILGAGAWLYERETERSRAQKLREIESIATLKIDQITNWRQERLMDAASGARWVHFVDAMRDDPADGTHHDPVTYEADLENYVAVLRYERAFLVTPDARIVYAAGSGARALVAAEVAAVRAASRGHRPLMTDFFMAPGQGARISSVAPIQDGERELGAIVLRRNPSNLIFPMLRRWPTPSPSAESVLVTRDDDAMLYITGLRHRAVEPMSLRIPLAGHDVAELRALTSGSDITVEGRDYRGAEVIARAERVPKTDWVLIAKVDRDEVLAEARYRGLTIFAVALLGTLLSALLGMLLYSRRQQGLDREMLAAERGRLHALQAVADGEARLRQLNEHLERLVGERTRELVAARDVAESANRVKDIFLATISHELRTPLNSIIGFSDILLGGLAGELNREQKTQLGIIHKSGQQLLALIGDVLDISKIEAGQLRLDLARVPLQEMLLEQRRVFELQARERGLALEFDYPPEPIEVIADAQRLRQVIGNLMSNALKFTDRGSVGLLAERLGDRVRITVHDSGVGIAADDQLNLFKPFRRLAPRQGGSRDGTGLGLAISHRLVGAMGGEMGVSSEPGRGSRFWFTLPSA
jgi:signal transduction histidine kinase